MFRFGSPHMFYLLLLVPALVALFILARHLRARRIARFGDPATVRALMPEASPNRERNKFILWLTAIVLLVFALARPQTGSRLKEELRAGVEIMFVVDVSNSMMAQDFEPNRLERTKYAINRILGELGNDKVGLIVFAGDAYVQLPITADYVTARSFLSHLSPNMVSRQGTAIGSAIALGTNSFSTFSEGSRVMIVISDGENHEDDALSAAAYASEKGVKIYTIGIGTPEGAPVMINGEYIKDQEGNMVVSKLDEALLEQIAIVTGGAYIRATNQNIGLGEIIEEINRTQKSLFVATIFDEYNEQYQYFLGAALLFLLLDCLISGRRNRRLARFDIFGKKKHREL